MVEDLLRSVLPDVFAAADWSTLKPVPTVHVGENLRQRLGDTVWSVKTRGADGRISRLHVLVLLELQSRTDRAMALRVMEYTPMHYLALVRQGEMNRGAGCRLC